MTEDNHLKLVELNRQAADLGHTIVPERRSPHWWDKWVNPTTVLALIGGIIWGIQLNALVVNHTAQLAALTSKQQSITDVVSEQSRQMTKISTILTGLLDRMNGHAATLEKHREDAEVWKRRIELNTQKLNTLMERIK